MDDIEQFFQHSHYNIIRILLSISGLWPFHTRKTRYAIYLVMTLIFGSGFTFQILGIIEIRHDTFEVIDSIPMLFFTTVIISKLICMIYTLPQIKVLLIKIQEYYLSPKSDEEIKIQNSHAQYGRKLGYAYTGFLLGHSVLYILLTLLTKIFYTESEEADEIANKAQIGFPHRVNYMVDLDTYYIPIFIHCAICDFSFTVLLVVFDVLYLIVIEHCCGLFAALRYRLEIALVSKKGKLIKDKSYSNIVYSIRRHTETMQFVTIIESVYSLPLFIHIGLTMFLISILGYQIINDIENITRFLKPAAFLSAAVINIFFENWQGQKIIDFSGKIFESTYNTEWYNMPIATRKLLIIMMMRSEEPSMIRIGKIIVLSYITFNTVLRTSSSYFMLLRSL